MMRATLVLVLLMAQALAMGQSATARRDSLRLLIAGMKEAIVRIDSSGPSAKSIRARLELAAVVKGKESMKLLDAAASLSDSLGDPVLGVESRTALANQLSASGNHKRAYAEMLRVIELRDQIEYESVERQTQEAADFVRALHAERDSAKTVAELRTAEAEARALHSEERATHWMYITGVAVLLSLLLIVILIMRNSSRLKRLRAELHSLRAEIEELKKPRNTFRTPVAPPPVEADAPPAVLPKSDQRPLRLPDDPMVSGMFLRQAPERLAAFKDARSRGDLEKAVRVVHTLKPTLASIDDERFTALCARLVAPGAIGTAAWNSDADALSTAIEVLLGMR